MDSRPSVRRYSISLLASVCLFGAANYLHFTRRVTCFDCFFPYGLPFTFFHEGGYAGGGGFEWVGAALDILVALASGVAFALVWKWFAQKYEN